MGEFIYFSEYRIPRIPLTPRKLQEIYRVFFFSKFLIIFSYTHAALYDVPPGRLFTPTTPPNCCACNTAPAFMRATYLPFLQVFFIFYFTRFATTSFIPHGKTMRRIAIFFPLKCGFFPIFIFRKNLYFILR